MALRKKMVRMATGVVFAVALISQASAQTAEGVLPIVVEGNATCATVAAACGLVDPTSLQISPPKNTANTIFTHPSGNYKIVLTVTGSTVKFVDTSPLSQQRDTSGVEAVIVRGSSTANLYCRVNWVTDEGLVSPNLQVNQVTFCWSAGSCKVPEDRVATACNAYNADPSNRKADILQAILDEPSLPANLCGCPSAQGQPRLVRACDPTLPQTQRFAENAAGVCNPTSSGGNLSGLQAETTAITGSNSCILKQSGGTYYRVCF
jgi:hypothetical protein